MESQKSGNVNEETRRVSDKLVAIVAAAKIVDVIGRIVIDRSKAKQ